TVSIEATLTLISGVQKVTVVSFNPLLTPTILFCLNYDVTMETSSRQRLQQSEEEEENTFSSSGDEFVSAGKHNYKMTHRFLQQQALRFKGS
ncbi:uncharacterized, partial [Tachysurus ichikawai]